MLTEFLNILEYSFESFDDSLTLHSVSRTEEALEIAVSLHYEDEKDEYKEKYAEWKIICPGVKNHMISLGDRLGYDFFETTENFILTWEFIKPTCAVSFYGESENTSQVFIYRR